MSRLPLLMFSLLLIPSTILTAPDTSRQIVYKAVTELDLEGVPVDATVEKPDGVIVTEAPRPVFHPMIELRKEFNAEMREGTGEIQ